jgi:hypothetical protein
VPVLRRAARVAGLLTVLVGVVHVGVGLAEYDWPSFDALWFHGSGIGVILTGALTVLATSDHAWGALVIVAVFANLLGVALAVGFGALSHWRQPQGPILIALFAVGMLGSLATVTATRRA